MNLENSQVRLEGNRVIGLKDTDMKKLADAMQRKESSFSAPLTEEAIIDGVVNQVEDLAPQGEEINPVMVDNHVVEEVPVNPNIFDQGVPNYNEPQLEVPKPIYEQPQVSSDSNVGSTIFDNLTEPEIQINNNGSNNLDTPQAFFNRVEQEEKPQPEEPSFTTENDDPALIILDNLRKVISDKNTLINALNEKVKVLESQLKTSEDARKISEAQRDAAQTTLAQARQAETSGPTLVYQQQTN